MPQPLTIQIQFVPPHKRTKWRILRHPSDISESVCIKSRILKAGPLATFMTPQPIPINANLSLREHILRVLHLRFWSAKTQHLPQHQQTAKGKPSQFHMRALFIWNLVPILHARLDSSVKLCAEPAKGEASRAPMLLFCTHLDWCRCYLFAPVLILLSNFVLSRLKARQAGHRCYFVTHLSDFAEFILLPFSKYHLFHHREFCESPRKSVCEENSDHKSVYKKGSHTKTRSISIRSGIQPTLGCQAPHTIKWSEFNFV
jgi:hypothetical protein